MERRVQHHTLENDAQPHDSGLIAKIGMIVVIGLDMTPYIQVLGKSLADPADCCIPLP